MRSQALLLAVVACAVYFGEVDLTARAQGSAANPLWPNSIVVNGANVTVYQPQAIEWPDHQRLTTREAIAITLPGEKAPWTRDDGDFIRDGNRCGNEQCDPVKSAAFGVPLSVSGYRAGRPDRATNQGGLARCPCQTGPVGIRHPQP